MGFKGIVFKFDKKERGSSYLNNIIYGLGVEHINFHWILRDLSSVTEESPFEYETIVAASQSRVISAS